ncbi:MAG: hypothetical protein ABI768_03145 [Acidobacteriota bacterium]
MSEERDNIHGFVRETVDVDVLLTPESLDRFRERLAQMVGEGPVER